MAYVEIPECYSVRRLPVCLGKIYVRLDALVVGLTGRKFVEVAQQTRILSDILLKNLPKIEIPAECTAGSNLERSRITARLRDRHKYLLPHPMSYCPSHT